VRGQGVEYAVGSDLGGTLDLEPHPQGERGVTATARQCRAVMTAFSIFRSSAGTTLP